MNKKKKKQNNLTPKKMFTWALTFTKRVILLVVVVWFFAMFYSATMITVAIFQTGNFSYLDTFITELNQSFMLIIGTNLLSKTCENIFKYNDFGGPAKTYTEDNIEDSEDV